MSKLAQSVARAVQELQAKKPTQKGRKMSDTVLESGDVVADQAEEMQVVDEPTGEPEPIAEEGEPESVADAVAEPVADVPKAKRKR